MWKRLAYSEIATGARTVPELFYLEEVVMEKGAESGETIACLTVHYLAAGNVERTRQFIESHGGCWAVMPPETGAQYFIDFPVGTHIQINTRYRPHQHCCGYYIYLPDGAYLQAISLRIPGQGRHRNIVILPSLEPPLATRPGWLVAGRV